MSQPPASSSPTQRQRRDISEREMGFWDHIGELRKRLFISVAIVVVCAGASFLFMDQLMAIITRPLLLSKPGMKLITLAPTEAFFFYMRLCVVAAIVVASPLILHQLWLFLAPALKPAERRKAGPVVPAVLLLFASGVAFVYYLLLPPSLQLLMSFGDKYLQANWSSDYYYNFVFSLCLAGGLLFELPIIMWLLGWLGIVTPALLWKQTGTALVILMIAAAIITPTGDAFTMLIFTAPLMLLYFLGIGVVALTQRDPGRTKQKTT